MAAVVVTGIYPRISTADVMEQGVRWECGQDALSIKQFSADGGGGQEGPFKTHETVDSAVWNIDRTDRDSFPIVKQCKIGIHKITTVISEGCASYDGIGISISIYSDAEVEVNRSAKWNAANKIYSDRPSFISAAIFGDWCWKTTDPFFSEISVRKGEGNGLIGEIR